VNHPSRPLDSLQAGHWFKLICGASFQHLPEIRDLSLVYTLAGADCIDVAADLAVVYAARQGIEAAQALHPQTPERSDPPLLMVSLNDGEDPHFRKAAFNPDQCPPTCPQPCVTICPAQAIAFDVSSSQPVGVIEQRCYGCGRCLPICPIQQITTRTHQVTPETLGPWLEAGWIDALEIHTQVGRQAEFGRVWQAISPYRQHLKLLAVSCPDGEDLIAYLWSLWELLAPLECPLIWQTDGRPMSGDIGDGATRATIKLGQKVLAAGLPGYVQLAGGTNRYTVDKLRELQLLSPRASQVADVVPNLVPTYIAGVAYGSYARSLLAPIHAQMEHSCLQSLQESPPLLAAAIDLATSLVSPLKSTQLSSLSAQCSAAQTIGITQSLTVSQPAASIST
jgi:Fe-S-cluster-containing hydrogenase component 2